MPIRSENLVIVAHPGAAPSIYELVGAVERLGYQTEFETGYYASGTTVPERLAAILPGALRDRLRRELNRRRSNAINHARIRQHPFLELLYVAAARLARRFPALPSWLMHRRNQSFDRAVAHKITSTKPAVLIGHDTSTVAAIRAAKTVGTISLVNQLIGHVAIGDKILREEAERQPLWADSLHADNPDWLIEQCRQEVLEADYVLSPSDYVRATLEAVGIAPERILDLPFGVRSERFKPVAKVKSQDDKFRLLYVGQISQRKGLSYLLEAVRQLDDPAIELTLVGGIVGAGHGLAGFDGWFRHIANVPHREVAALYQNADLFVYPSLHEGSALAIFEAMASGLPVITTKSSGSMVRDGVEGMIVPIRDAGAIAEAIIALKNDVTRRTAMAQAARGRAEEFPWSRYEKSLGMILDRVIDDQCAGLLRYHSQ